ALGRFRESSWQSGQSREGVEQDWRRRAPDDQPGHARTVRAADPHADGSLAVEADRPRVAIAVARAGLERDAPAHGVFWRRRADQDIADVPGGDWIEQAFCRRCFQLVAP